MGFPKIAAARFYTINMRAVVCNGPPTEMMAKLIGNINVACPSAIAPVIGISSFELSPSDVSFLAADKSHADITCQELRKGRCIRLAFHAQQPHLDCLLLRQA